MNLGNTDAVTPAEMRRHIEKGRANVAWIGTGPDADARRRDLIGRADLVWALWPATGPNSQMGRSLAIPKGALMLEAMVLANEPSQALAITTIEFSSRALAEAVCATDGNDALLAA